MEKNTQNENLSPDLFQVVGPKSSDAEKIERKSLTDYSGYSIFTYV